MKTIIYLFLMTFILNQQIKSQVFDWKQKRILGGAALSYQRGATSQDYFYFGIQIPLSEKFHTGLSYGYFSRSDINMHQAGTALGYDLFSSQRGRLYTKTDLSFFYRSQPSNSTNSIDRMFFRHSFGLGYLMPIFNHWILDIESNFFGFFYGRNEPYQGSFKMHEASEIKFGIGYEF